MRCWRTRRNTPILSICADCTWQTDGESVVRETLAQLLCSATLPTYEAVRARVRGPYVHAGVPHLEVSDPDLRAYDRLLSGAAEAAVCA